MMKKLTVAIAVVALAMFTCNPVAHAAPILTTATYTNSAAAASGTPQLWTTGTNWSSNPDWPSAVGAGAIFNGPVGTRFTAAASAITVGSISIDNNTAFASTISNGTGGSLTFDQVLAGPATITVNSSSPASPADRGNLTISATMTLTDSLTAIVNQTNQTSSAGALNLTGSMSGGGGVTKNGDGLMTFGTGAKTYMGATTLNGGRTRISLAAQPSGTSSFTINAGAQLTLISASSYTFGAGPLNLNGDGAITGPFAAFKGAIRSDTNLAATINNDVVLQSDTLLHVEGSATGSLTLPGDVSGDGKLFLTALASSANQGQLVLGGTNSYSGGTLVRGGNLVASAASVNAFGSGDVDVNDATAPDAAARITILAGASNAIDDLAFLFLQGGGAAGIADENFAVLGTGINESVRRLYLGGLVKTPGTYGSLTSPATNKSNEFFSGDGIVTVLVPEPTSFMLVLLGAIGLISTRRR